MIDDRTAVRKDLHPYVGEFVWTQENNYFGWRSLLEVESGGHCVEGAGGEIAQQAVEASSCPMATNGAVSLEHRRARTDRLETELLERGR